MKASFISNAQSAYVPCISVSDATAKLSLAPESAAIPVAVPPEEIYKDPKELTVVRFAVPPPETCKLPPELTVVLFAVPPFITYISLRNPIVMRFITAALESSLLFDP